MLTELSIKSCAKVISCLNDDNSFYNQFTKLESGYNAIEQGMVVIEYSILLRNLIYTLPHTHPCFQLIRNTGANTLAQLEQIRYPFLDIMHILTMRFFLNQLNVKLNETQFKHIIDLTADQFSKVPKANISISFGWLLNLYYKTLANSNLIVTPSILNSFNKLLSMLPARQATSAHVKQLYYFIDCFLLYWKCDMQTPETLGPALTNSLLKWLLPNAEDEIDLCKIKNSILIIKKIVSSEISKGASVNLYGSLRKITEYICSHYPKASQNPQIDEVLLDLLELTLKPQQAPDPESRQLWEPVIVNICEKIIAPIGRMHPLKLEEFLLTAGQDCFRQHKSKSSVQL